MKKENTKKTRTCEREIALLKYPRSHASGVKSQPRSMSEPPAVRTCPGLMCVKASSGCCAAKCYIYRLTMRFDSDAGWVKK